MKYRNLIFLILSLLLINASVSEEENKDILTLTTKNLNETFELYGKLIVLYYNETSPNENEKKALKIFEDLPKEIKKESFFVGKVNIQKNKELLSNYYIVKYPTIVLYIIGEPYYYDGDISFDSIVEWVRKKQRMSAIKVNDEFDIHKYIHENNNVFVYYGNDALRIEMFKKTAKIFDDVKFAFCSNFKVAQKLNATNDSIILYQNKSFKDQEPLLQFFFKKDIENFVRRMITPRPMRPLSNNLYPILYDKKPGLFYFPYKKSGRWVEHVKLINSIKDKISIIPIIPDINANFGHKIIDYYGIKEVDLPQLFILDPREGLSKYKSNFEKITEDKIIEFVKDWENNKLKPFYKTAEIPKENLGDTFEVVGKNYEKEILDNDKDILIFFYSPLCPYCKEFNPTFEKLSRKMKKLKNKKIIFAKMDVTENDAPNVYVKKYPSLMFYPGNKKNEKPIIFYEHKSEENIIKFLKENAYNKMNFEEPKKDKKKTEDL